MQLLVPIGTRLGKTRLHDDGQVLDLNVKDHLARNKLSTLSLKVRKLFNPALKKLFKASDEYFFDFFIKTLDPIIKIA